MGRRGSKGLGSLCQFPGRESWGSWEPRLPLHPRQAWGPFTAPPTLPGLPDEAFESLTQLQHLCVAHNKVSPQPHPQAEPSEGAASVTQPRVWRGQLCWGSGGAKAHQDQCGCGLCPHSSQWPLSFCPGPSVSRIWLPTK